MNYFLDSSVLVKRYVNEGGSGWMHKHVFTGNHRLLIAQITPVEVMSAVYRQYRSGNYAERDADAIKLWLKRHL
ncbi:MAG TPA: type II toxin-antitoxin system VapC family toxin, partial [Aggregatilineales bacterium]|nr:type II toxin-antitoxin system VapC family toxin [Aggregatilineales bacterium]